MKIYADIIKTDDEKRMVYGYASTEALDSQGEIVRKDAIEEALPDYMRFGNVREMHQASAVGVTKEASIDGKGLYLAAKVVDDSAWAKVKEGVYKGFSIGGKALERLDNVVTKLRLAEISLVDRPANPEAIFDVFKSDASDPDDDKTLPNDDDDLKAVTAENPAGYTVKRDFTEDERKEAAKKGHAMPDGSFPIITVGDLENAIKAYGRAKDKAAVKKHIVKRAKALGATDKLPEDWTSKTDDPVDLKKYMGGEAWDAARACSCLSDIYMLFERERAEGDPGQMAALQQVIDGLKVFIASEIQEPSDYDDVRMADKSFDLTKTGARNSIADAKHIQQIHDHSIALGADCGSGDKAQVPDDLQKMDVLEKLKVAEAALTKIEGEKSDLSKRIAELEAMPAQTNIRLQAVRKGDDATGAKPNGVDIDAEVQKIIDSDIPPIQKSAAFLKLQYRIRGVS